MKYFSKIFKYVVHRGDGRVEVYNVPMQCGVRRGPSFIFPPSASLSARCERCLRRLGARRVLVFGFTKSRGWSAIASFSLASVGQVVCDFFVSPDSPVPAPFFSEAIDLASLAIQQADPSCVAPGFCPRPGQRAAAPIPAASAPVAAAPVPAAPVAAPAPRVASSSPLSSALVALFRRASVLAS